VLIGAHSNAIIDQAKPAIVATPLKVAAAAIAKFTICVSIGTFVAALLFRLDAKLISQPKRYDTNLSSVQMLDFVRAVPDDFTRTKERRLPKKPEPPKEPPPPPKLRVDQQQKITSGPVNVDIPDIEMSFGDGGGPFIGQWRGNQQSDLDSDVVPIVRIAPQYPREALLKGIEGWVKLEFVIEADGTVADPEVIAAEPIRMFNNAAMRAILRWKFRPRFVDGRAVSRRGSQTIEFKLEEY